MENIKRTKDLTDEEILQFDPVELKRWMERVMARLYKLVEEDKYAELTSRFIALCKRGIGHMRRGLIELVNVIKAQWQEPNLYVVK